MVRLVLFLLPYNPPNLLSFLLIYILAKITKLQHLFACEDMRHLFKDSLGLFFGLKNYFKKENKETRHKVDDDEKQNKVKGEVEHFD